MEPLPASQDALRLELRLAEAAAAAAAAAGARSDADANGGGLPLLCLVLFSLRFSLVLVHRCRPRAVVDLFLRLDRLLRFLPLLPLLAPNLCSPFSSPLFLRHSRRLSRDSTKP